MNADKRWIPVLAMTLSAALLAAVAATLRRRNVRAAHDEQHKTTLKTWENEGGNLAPSQISYTRVEPDKRRQVTFSMRAPTHRHHCELHVSCKDRQRTQAAR